MDEMDDDDYDEDDVEAALRGGNVIETYPDTGRGTSYLVAHWIEDRPIHVVAADKGEETIVITVYDPRSEPGEWTDHYMKRHP